MIRLAVERDRWRFSPYVSPHTPPHCALAEAAYLGDTLEPSDSEDEMEVESDLDNGDEEITSDGEDA